MPDALNAPEEPRAAPAPPAAPALAASGPADPWPAQNRRRLELIAKKYDGNGLETSERAELERLNTLADAVVDAALPPPLFTPEERAFIDAKAAGR